METSKSTRAGVLFWTPAPARTSPASSVASEDAWEDEEEEQAEKDDDFVGHMDENGIIGLQEALEGVQSGEACSDADADLGWQARDTPPEELSYNLSERLSRSESPGEDEQIQSPCDDSIGSLNLQTVDDKYLDMTEEAEEDTRRKRNERSSTSRELGTTNVWTGSYVSKGNEKMSSARSAGVSNHHCLIPRPASPVAAPTLPHLLHFTAEEMAAAPGIEAETFPEVSFTESPPESHRSQRSHKSSPRPEIRLRAPLQPVAASSSEVASNHHRGASDKRPTPSPRKMRQRSPEATHSPRSLSAVGADSLKCKHHATSPDKEPRTPRARRNAAEVDETRKVPLSHRTPDFSKVEPRVRFPKGGYKPPKSRRSSARESLSPEPPLVFKSPADIVKEVLLNITDGSPAPSRPDRPAASAPDFTVPQEFRCPRQATTLLEQLQEDYNTLLTKYAEAENTIDRLRLEAKVNLFSDPPKPGHLVQSGLNKDASRLVMLDFPQAQRAEINSAPLHPDRDNTHQRNPSSRSPGPQGGQQAAKILYSQADKFLQQMQTFEDLLKCNRLKPFQQMQGLSQLAEGLDSLERGYMLARDECKLLWQRGAEISSFDPERELEGLIFECGLRMDELKEQAEQMLQEQPTCEAPPPPPPPPPQPTPSPVRPERGETLTHPQSPPAPLLVDPGEAAAAEVSSASEETEDEETLNSLYLKPLNGKHTRVEQDFDKLMDHYQSFKELPKLLEHSQRDAAPPSAALKTDTQPGDEEEERRSPGTGNLEAQKSLPQRKSDHQDSPPVRANEERTSRSGPPSRRASNLSSTLPVDPPSSRRKLEVGKSHSSSLSSLGEITAPERRNSKLQTGSSRVLSQDGIISPETDSGFIGSESSRLTPAAAPSPLHQRASESVSVPLDGSPGKPQTGPVSAPSPASSPSHSGTATEPGGRSRLGPDQPRRSREEQRRRTFSCSPHRWVGQTGRSGADTGISESGLESDTTHTVSEVGRNDQYTDSITSLHSSSPSSSPAARHHHGNSLRALRSSQAANRSDAIQTLQDEVNILRERLEICLRKGPAGSVRAAQHSTSTPQVRSDERWSDVTRGRRDTQVNEVGESVLRRTARERPPPAHRQKPQPVILTASEPSTPQPQPQPQPQPLVSRCTQTTAAAPDSCRSHTNTVRSRTHPRQHPRVSVQVREAADEPDSRSRRAPPCPQCSSRLREQPEGPDGGNREPTHSSCCRHCPLCGWPELYRSTEPDSRRVSDSPSHTSRHQPAESPNTAVRSRRFAAAPALLQCMPVCAQPLLLYSSPLYMSPSNSTGTSSRVRGRTEERGSARRSLSMDKQRSVDRSVDSSLDRAIRAARRMRHTSGHMARSLATGLNYQVLLTQSCSY